MRTTAIEVRELSKRYGSVWALKNVSLTVFEGEVFGLLGPNGAGKTTMVNILSAKILPTSGYASVCGYDCSRDLYKVRLMVGVAPANTRSLYWRLTGEENLLHFADLYYVPPQMARAQVEKCLALLNLLDVKKRTVSTYSHGMRAKLLLARAMIHNPSVLLLDEPWSALDPEGRLDLIDALKDIAADGRTVFLCSHDLALVEKVCTRVAIVNSGEIICQGTPSELRSRLPFGYVAEIRYSEALDVEKVPPGVPGRWKSVGNGLRIETSEPDQVLGWARDCGLLSRGIFSLRPSSLEDVYFFEMQRRLDEGEPQDEKSSA